MGKKAKVQIQKAKPEKRLNLKCFMPSLSRCYQWKEEKKKLATEEELAVEEGHNMKQRSFSFP